METFTWVPATCQPQAQPRVKKAQFGDGYSQRSSDGINHLLRTYNLTFADYPALIEPIDAFLEQHAGVQAFWFKAPDTGRMTKVICGQWAGARRSGWWEMSAIFQEVSA